MNARPNFSDFAHEVVLKKISQAKIGEKKSVSIEVICNENESKEYERVLRFLEQSKLISELKNSGALGYVTDEYGYEVEMYFYTPSFILNQKELAKVLIIKSIIPKYSLSMDAKRRLVINNTHLLITPQFSSPNYYFIEYCLAHPGEVIIKEDIEKIAGKMKQRFHTIINNLNISPNFNEIFFPQINSDATKFRNNVTTKDLIGLEINEKKIDKLIRKLKKI